MLEGLGSPFISELMLPPSKPTEGVTNSASNDPLVSKSVFTITEKAPTRTFFLLKVATISDTMLNRR